jgi:hypothetical protein
MLKDWRKKRAIKSYMKNLPSLLNSRYGFSDYYTKGQIEQTVAQSSLSMQFVDYAIAMFCDPKTDIYESVQHKSLRKNREYLATKYFGGNSGFSAVDVNTVMASSWFSESGIIDSVVSGGSENGGGGGGE